MHDGWPYVVAVYVLIALVLGLWFGMITRRFGRVRDELAAAERAHRAAASVSAAGSAGPDDRSSRHG